MQEYLKFLLNILFLKRPVIKQKLLNCLTQLEPYGVLQFARSGRVAITKQVKELNSYLKEMDEANRFKSDKIEILN